MLRCLACLMCATVLSLLWPLTLPPADTTDAPSAAAVFAPLPEDVLAGLPQGEPRRVTVTTQRLLQGRMLLIDGTHPIPEDAVPESCFGVLGFSRGRIACRDLQATLGKEALIQLQELCVDGRNRGVTGLTLFAGARSREQQRILLMERMEILSRDMSPEEALAAARKQVDMPGCSEHQLGRSADIRVCRAWNQLPEGGRLAETTQGAWLLTHCWEYGFIQRYPEADPALDDHRPYCFRYVGTAHAALMHALELPFEEYLALLRREGAVTLLNENGAPLFSAVCTEAGEHHTMFEITADAEIEDASLDNTGWALLSLSYPASATP